MSNLTTITLENLENLAVDGANRLYWQGERIVVETMLTLPTPLDWAVGIAAVLASVHYLILIGGYCRKAWRERSASRRFRSSASGGAA